MLRTRVCGLIFSSDKILLIKHNLRGKPFYSPPGGAVEFGENMLETLQREIREETFLEVCSSKFKFITEFISPPLHAIEIFYHITNWSGNAMTGQDPETTNSIIIESVNWYSMEEIKRLPKGGLHHILHNCNNLRQVLELSGYIPYPRH